MERNVLRDPVEETVLVVDYGNVNQSIKWEQKRQVKERLKVAQR